VWGKTTEHSAEEAGGVSGLNEPGGGVSGNGPVGQHPSREPGDDSDAEREGGWTAPGFAPADNPFDGEGQAGERAA
jgi:hypothetical protein